jgi:hypothetical protein
VNCWKSKVSNKKATCGVPHKSSIEWSSSMCGSYSL